MEGWNEDESAGESRTLVILKHFKGMCSLIAAVDGDDSAVEAGLLSS
jgi:hypothetical protein